ncbi:MAG: ParA family protein [Oscillospiraceae bacterium]
MDMGKIIAVANQKGGVGKTTSCVNSVSSLAGTERYCLQIDPQGAAHPAWVSPRSRRRTSMTCWYAGRRGGLRSKNAIWDVLPSNKELSARALSL